jgi:uncharacterized Zn finger protein
MSSVESCPHCGGHTGRLSEQPIRDGRKQLRLECGACGRFIKWVSRTVANMRAALRGEVVDLAAIHA